MKKKIQTLFGRSEFRFLLVGILNTLFGTTVMFLAYNAFHLSYWLSSALNYILGSVLSFFLNKYFTFRSKKKSLRELLAFILNITICYFLAYGLAKALAHWLLAGQAQALMENISMLLGMGLFVVLNYMGQRFFVFRK